MRLPLADRILIRLLAGAQSHLVCEILESRLANPVHVKPAAGRVGLGREMRVLGSICAGIVRAWLASGEEIPTAGSVYYDIAVEGIDQSSIERRREFFLHRYTDAGEFRRLSQTTRMGGVLWSWRTLGVLAATPLLAMSGLVLRRSILGMPRVEIVRRCLTVEGYAYRTTNAQAFIFRQSNTDSLLIGAYLMGSPVTGYSIASSTPLWPRNTRMLGDVLVLCSPYQEYEIKEFASGDARERAVLWGPEDIVDLARYGGPSNVLAERAQQPIGVYTQGYWLRLRRGSIDPEIGAVLDRAERRLTEMMVEFGKANGVAVRLLLHPMERRNAKETADYYGSWNPEYRSLLWLDDEENSALTFGQVGVGVTTFSTVGFDRLYCGFRTLFYVGDTQVFVPTIDGPFAQVIIADSAAFVTALEQVVQQTHVEFMLERFGRESWLNA